MVAGGEFVILDLDFKLRCIGISRAGGGKQKACQAGVKDSHYTDFNCEYKPLSFNLCGFRGMEAGEPAAASICTRLTCIKVFCGGQGLLGTLYGRGHGRNIAGTHLPCG